MDQNTTTEIQGLTVESVDSAGRTYYAPVAATVRGVSQYNPNQYSFDGLPGYWEWNGASALAKGTAYKMDLTTRPKTGANARPGSLYQDIRSAVATESAPSVQAPQSGSQRDQPMQWPEGEDVPRYIDPPPNPAALGACNNHAVDLIVAGFFPLPEGRTIISWILEVRAAMYYGVNQSPIEPQHFCYAHNQGRRQGPRGGWGHETEGSGFCLEQRLAATPSGEDQNPVE